jgi:hypothetical protein
MQTIIRARNQGKTSILATWVKEGRAVGEKRVLLVANTVELYRVRTKYGLVDCEVSTISQWLETSRYGKGKTKIAIDNLELAIETVIKNVEMVSITETGE